MKPYGLVSDTHFHKWSAFSQVDESGQNSRLRIQLAELRGAAVQLASVGGDTLYHAGDMFHVRGSIAPSVLNPVLDTFSIIRDMGIKVIVIPGNHDLETNEVQFNGNASNALAGIGVLVLNDVYCDDQVLMIPWQHDIAALKHYISMVETKNNRDKTDLIIHAPVDGVIIGIPDHGLTAKWLGEQGFRRVFAGHYHNYVDFGNGVYSIGALTHQTWSDVGSKAGYLIVEENKVRSFETSAPKFIDIDSSKTATMETTVPGNYVRVKARIKAESQVAELREALMGLGAAGVIIEPIRESTVVSREGATISSGKSLEKSLVEFIKMKKISEGNEVGKLCMDILDRVEVLS